MSSGTYLSKYATIFGIIDLASNDGIQIRPYENLKALDQSAGKGRRNIIGCLKLRIRGQNAPHNFGRVVPKPVVNVTIRRELTWNGRKV
ncbi:hypothetical protein AVEN_190607-1 [Araneus ventricosus]|uniref:Uncharacterized protein n=1 Tax=Araneus ventricosus TaxID=182803 RepID=A0A4Y2CEF6_ARAVE|nr:hypothetical protein AVEN_190607-1 [Araneus ventricosus]